MGPGCPGRARRPPSPGNLAGEQPRHLRSRGADLSVVRDAAGADPEAAEQWRTNQGQRYISHRSLAGILAAKGALREGMSVEQAADIIFTLASPEVYLLLTAVRGWPPAQWQDWLTDTIAQAVLR